MSGSGTARTAQSEATMENASESAMTKALQNSNEYVIGKEKKRKKGKK